MKHERAQFGILYREFLFRIVDLEVLSSHALGDSSKLLGQFAALLIFISLLLSLSSLGVGDSRTPPVLRLFQAWSAEHFLIATTMLVAGLFAVLSWDSTFPDRRDVHVLAPLPVRVRTLFLAKAAASATAVGLTVALLHAFAGLAWPAALGLMGTARVDMPALGFLPAMPRVDAAGVEPLLRRDLAPYLSPETGVAIGVITRGQRRVSAYGRAKPDSIYQIGSISKTFTGLLLAQMAANGSVRLKDPLRELLPFSTVRKPAGREITLLDLVTHRSGLPPLTNVVGTNRFATPGDPYRIDELYAYIARRGVARQANPPFVYSNGGFALLGQALASRTGITYEKLVATQIAGPFGLRDTAVVLTAEQQRRLIQGYSVRHEPRPPWDIGAFAPAGGIYSTAGDLLNYLQSQVQEGSPGIRLSHELQAEITPGLQIALAWVYDEDSGTYWHNGAISGYTSHALFNPKEGYAVAVLVNQALSLVTLSDLIAQHVRQRLTGVPAVSLATVTVPDSGGVYAVARMLMAYWLVMLLAGTFVFSCLLTVQGLAAQLLPRQLFLRASSFLQLAAFCAIVCGYFLQPLLPNAPALISANGDSGLGWSPTYWFLGLFQQLLGSPALSVPAQRAWLGLAAALCAAVILYALSYFRTLRQIAEEPDITPGARGAIRLPRFGSSPQTAIVHFSIRTLLRSRLHRLVLAFYLGIGFAFAIFLVKVPAAGRQLDDAPVTGVWGQVNTPVLAATIALLGFATIGVRVIFSVPLDLRANWIFRITGVRRASECLNASRRSLLVLSLLPVWVASAVICLWLWPWSPALAHLAILAGLGIILAEICLHNFRKIPFTCSYLPGKSQVHLAVLGGLGLLWFLALSVRYERRALENSAGTAAVILMLALIAALARWRAQAQTDGGEEVEFEDAPEPAVRALGLNRDGTWEVGTPPEPRSERLDRN